MPRGAETAKILYNSTRGWVTHNEVGLFSSIATPLTLPQVNVRSAFLVFFVYLTGPAARYLATLE